MTFDRAILAAFLFFIGGGIGAGLYETRVVYPNWAPDPVPETLKSKLVSSGQAAAARRFWPFVSPIAMLLAIVNTYLAWHHVGMLRVIWLVASLSILTKSVATYAYFAPTMIRRIERPETLETAALRRTVSRWVRWSPLRLVAEVIAWVAGIWVLTSI